MDGLELNDDEFVARRPKRLHAQLDTGHFIGLIRAAVGDATGRERQVQLAVGRVRWESPSFPSRRTRRGPLGIGHEREVHLRLVRDRLVEPLRPAAALAVGEAPAQAYNPLFIYGGTGLGKTHLLQAIAQYVSEHPGELSVRYVTSETFMNDFINALRDKRIEGFKQRYRAYDVLLIDDIQFSSTRSGSRRSSSTPSTRSTRPAARS